MSVNQELQDRAVQHAINIRRYGNGLAEKIVALLDSVDEDLTAKLAAALANVDERGIALPKTAQKRITQLLDELRALNAAIYLEVADTLSDELTGLAKVEAAHQTAAITAALPVSYATAIPTANRLKAIIETSPMEGALLSSWTKGMEQGRIDRIEAAIRKGLVQGLGTDDIVRSIRGTKKLKYQDGILEISRRSARSIVRTATTHVSNVAAQQTWKENEKVVKGWQFLSTLDSRTTITCAALSGQVFPIGEGPIPPRHIGCRSVSIAVTKSWREMGFDSDELSPSERSSMDGQVAGDITFAEWLKKKGEDTQNTILGPTRASLFRDGQLSLSDFIKNDGTVLTLEQLRKQYNLPN